MSKSTTPIYPIYHTVKWIYKALHVTAEFGFKVIEAIAVFLAPSYYKDNFYL